MAKGSVVSFKGRGDGLTVVLDRSASFQDIEEAMRAKISDARSFFGDTRTILKFSGRPLSGDEESKLLEIVRSSSSLSLAAAAVSAEAPDKQQTGAGEHTARFHNGSLRSGQSLRFAGSVVVLGDVNPGAEIFAEGNIVVLGGLRGLAHAGCSGRADCYIAALKLVPTQLRIAEHITYIPKEIARDAPDSPSYAYVEDDRIYIVPLKGADRA